MPTDFLTDVERERLSTYPEEISSGDLGRFFTLTAHDLEIVVQQRGDHNRLGFALQLCTLHYLGFIPNNLLDSPPAVVRLLAHQLGVSSEALQAYGEREQTRSDHLAQILPHLGYRRTSPNDLAEIEAWLVARAGA
jgi:TnpA family transposase